MYGIPNCNTVKRASDWLKEHDVPFSFHDYKKEGISKKKLKQWCKYFGWENVLNKRGTTWLELIDEEKDAITNEDTAIAFMKNNTSSIKRPILEAEGTLFIRFNEEEYSQLLSKK